LLPASDEITMSIRRWKNLVTALGAVFVTSAMACTASENAGAVFAPGPDAGDQLPDSAFVCTSSIAEACNAHPHSCVMDWTNAKSPSSWCTNGDAVGVYAGTCGSFDVVSTNYFDGATDFYYDQTTGKLVAIVSDDNRGVTCVASDLMGTGFAQCDRTGQWLSAVCQDAGGPDGSFDGAGE